MLICLNDLFACSGLTQTCKLLTNFSKNSFYLLPEPLRRGEFLTNYCIGILEDYEGLLEIPESILIASHKPSYNKEFIHDLSLEAKQRKIIVINNGHHAMLKTCCSNFWWVD